MTVLLLVGVVLPGVGLFGASSDAEAATPCGSTGSFVSPSSCSYTAIGQDSFTVPLGVTSLALMVDGGAGGLGGGDGAQVTADIPVTPGNTEYVEVGVGGGTGGYGFITRAGSADGGFGGGLSGVYSCPGDGTNPSCALLIAGGVEAVEAVVVAAITTAAVVALAVSSVTLEPLATATRWQRLAAVAPVVQVALPV
jgi:hypothetical protein